MSLGKIALNKLRKAAGRRISCDDISIFITARPGIIKLFEALDNIIDGGLLIARFPTGYGKSLSSVFIAAAVAEAGLDLGILKVIHVLPMRSILVDLYKRAYCVVQHGLASPLTTNDVAYQAHVHIEKGLKDHLFLHKLIYTTFDSYMLNYAKVTPLRARYASYEAARTAIYTALTIFDEAHLFADIDVKRAYTSLVTVIKSLLEANLPVILLTATLSTSILDSIVKSAALPDTPCMLVDIKTRQKAVEECKHIVVDDPTWQEPRVTTRIERVGLDILPESLVEEVRRTYDEGGLVLIVRNKVDKAIATYKMLIKKNIIPRNKLVLIHGRLTQEDKKKAVDAINKLKQGPGVVVATQIIEAGVDIDSNLVITDAAPLAQLAQRAGRLCRHRPECRGKFIILAGDDEYYSEFVRSVYDVDITKKSVEAIADMLQHYGSVNWRVLDTDNSYVVALDKIYESVKIQLDIKLHDVLYALDTILVKTRKEALDVLEEFYSFVREDILLPILVAQVEESCIRTNELWNLYMKVVEVPLSYLNSGMPPRYQRILGVSDVEKDTIKVAYVYRASSKDETKGEIILCLGIVDIPLAKVTRKVETRYKDKYKYVLDPRKVIRLEYIVAKEMAEKGIAETEETTLTGIIGVIAKSDAYEPGIGFKTDVEVQKI